MVKKKKSHTLVFSMPKTSFSFCPTPCTNPPKCYGPERKLECIAKMSQFFSPLENRFILKFQSSIFSQRAQKPVQKPLISFEGRFNSFLRGEGRWDPWNFKLLSANKQIKAGPTWILKIELGNISHRETWNDLLSLTRSTASASCCRQNESTIGPRLHLAMLFVSKVL